MKILRTQLKELFSKQPQQQKPLQADVAAISGCKSIYTCRSGPDANLDGKHMPKHGRVEGHFAKRNLEVCLRFLVWHPRKKLILCDNCRKAVAMKKHAIAGRTQQQSRSFTFWFQVDKPEAPSGTEA
jgi:hypothetical protein